MKLKKLSLPVIGIFTITFLQAQSVDHFTGDFNYSIPLMAVPSPDGAAIPISAGYTSGIMVNQPASEIGLGWNLSAGGAITRSVSGLPDDWIDANVPNVQEEAFFKHCGPLNFKEGGDYNMLDIYTSTWKIDTPQFYFPDYDQYYVSGPGMGGMIEPHLFEYAQIERFFGETGVVYRHEADTDPENFYKKGQFIFRSDFADTLYSRYYPEPSDVSTEVIYPEDDATFDGLTIAIDFKGENSKGYNNENYGETANKNRLVASRYVEYFTNAEIDAGVTGFINFETGYERSSYPQDGIGAYRITNESGYTYHYSLPAYTHFSITGDLPLGNDYSDEYYYNSVTTTNHPSGAEYGYLVKDPENDNHMIEYKQVAKYAYQWLLTAVTGPDYVDVNTNNIVDAADKGYWVNYDYKLWSADFYTRGPFYGYGYAFTATEGEETENDIITADDKVSGRTGSFNTSKQDIYYLNKITTSTHTAVFVRDLRNDEHSAATAYDANARVETNISNTTNINLFGTLYDDGGSGGNFTLSDYTFTISPSSGDIVEIDFLEFDLGPVLANNNEINIYDGPNTSSTLLATYTPVNPPAGSIQSSGADITVEFISESGTEDFAGIKMNWRTIFDNDWPLTAPQLRVDKIILMENDDLAGITAPDSIVPPNGVWNTGATTNANGYFYDVDWYTDYSTAINAATLKSVEFETDYSLARKYYNNIKVHCSAQKNDSPDEVKELLVMDNDDYATSGKLTLNEIIIRDENAVQKTPSYLFDYNKDYSLDNPDYNPDAIDNWGYYKNDISEKGYSSYTTLQSKNYTDAWSLRKITTPLGGTVHVEYESDAYEKVIDEEGGFRGPSRTYLIENVTPVSGELGEEWYYTLEDEVEDFTELADNAPEGTAVKSFIPFTTLTIPPGTSGCLGNEELYINKGTTTFTTSTDKVSIDTLLVTYITEFNYERQTAPHAYFTTSGVTCAGSDLVYTGNGYFYFELPVGEEVYGGGVRVKRLTINNCTNDTYRQEYIYEGGVTPSEPDRIELPKQIKDHDQDMIDIKARGYVYDKHRMSAQVGYTTVTVKNMGQTNSPQGAVAYNFITDPAGIDNFEPTIVLEVNDAADTGCDPEDDPAPKDTAHIIDVSDKFSAFWGRMSSSTITDVNNNIVSFTKNTYTTMRQGTIVENYLFANNFCPVCEPNYPPGYVPFEGFYGDDSSPPEYPQNPCTQRRDIVCILRNYPAMLTKSETYDKGVKNTTEYLEFDDVTWSPTEISNTDMSNDVTISTAVPAFRVSEYSGTGSKAVDQDNTNQFDFTYSSKTVVNPDITSNDDFKSQSVKTIKQDYTVRKFNSTYYEFRNGAVTDSYWVGDRAYAWAGPLGTFGLYDETEFVAFDPTDAPGSVDPKWRYAGETSIFDEKRRVLENKSFGDKYSATKFGYSDKFPIASGSNVNFESFTHTSFEDKFTAYSGYDYYGGEVKHQNATVATSSGALPSHTGDKYIIVGSGQTGPMFIAKNISANNQNLMTGRTYRASVWVHTSSQADAKLYAELNGHDGVSVVSSTVSVRKDDANGITNGVWKLITLDIEIPENYVSSSGGGNNDFRVYVKGGASGNSYFDDLRVQPVEAGVSAAVYDEHTGRVTYTLDNNNFATKMVYDEAGNVIETYKEIEGLGLKKLSAVEYDFAR